MMVHISRCLGRVTANGKLFLIIISLDKILSISSVLICIKKANDLLFELIVA